MTPEFKFWGYVTVILIKRGKQAKERALNALEKKG